MPLILASGSAIRSKMLKDAGVAHIAVRPDVDEASVKARLSSADSIAGELARSKSLAVSSSRSADWVIGSDSVVTVGNRIFDKPRDRSEAAEHLRLFSGMPMVLTSAVALACEDECHWLHVDHARLKVRLLSDTFIEQYLDSEWPEVGYCVGVFRMEGRGVQLFESVDGSHFTILGMPLIPLLGALRERGIVPS